MKTFVYTSEDLLIENIDNKGDKSRVSVLSCSISSILSLLFFFYFC